MKKIDQHILIRYFLGQVSEEEKEMIRQWVEADDANRKQLIQERIRFDASILVEKPVVSVNRKLKFSPVLSWTLKIAASILLFVGTFYAYDTYKLDQLSRTYQCVQVPAGNRSHLILPDGTSVWLNANTTLRYPMAFSQKTRTIQLDGEAYLEVAKEEKPFIVETSKYNVEVLGTTFCVEAYKEKSDFRTMLYEGKVKLYNSDAQKAVYLSPGETAQLVDGNLTVISTTDLNSYRWKDGLIYIEDKSFAAIMQLFEKFYDVQIVINNKMVKELGYRGKLRISDGVDHALRVLQNDFPFKYKRDEENNIIYIN